MNQYLIIDSNRNFAENLYGALSRGPGDPGRDIKNAGEFEDLRVLSAQIVEWAKEIEKDACILVNAEGTLKGGHVQDHTLVDLAFWIRCKHRLPNPLVFYGAVPVESLLRAKPENYILLAPGCAYFSLPLGTRQLNAIGDCKPLHDLDRLKPFLRPRVNLGHLRHVHANYAAMAFMLRVAASVATDGRSPLEFEKAFASPQLLSFLDSLDYGILSTFFGLYKDTAFPKAEGRALTISPEVLASKRILLVDDLADAGWAKIVSQMLFGMWATNQLEAVSTPSVGVLEESIESHAPHLILLDLRLNDEKGPKPVHELSGYRLLRHLKSQPRYAGVPVVMFTATSSAETTKALVAAGAESVWTKPGIDEGLGLLEIEERYASLIGYIGKALGRFDSPVDLKAGVDYEDKRLEALRQVRYIDYRANLVRKPTHAFSHYTDIFVDTNIVLQSATAMSNIYKLAHISEASSHTLAVGGATFSVTVPKLVFLNFVVDELIEKSKTMAVDNPAIWKTGLFAYEVIRTLFGKGLARTEINSFDDLGAPEYVLRKPETEHYADDEIMYDIVNIISQRRFELLRIRQPKGRGTKRHIVSRTANYRDPDPKVLLLTNETKSVPGKIPAELDARVNALSRAFGSVEIMNYNECRKLIDSVRL